MTYVFYLFGPKERLVQRLQAEKPQNVYYTGQGYIDVRLATTTRHGTVLLAAPNHHSVRRHLPSNQPASVIQIRIVTFANFVVLIVVVVVAINFSLFYYYFWQLLLLEQICTDISQIGHHRGTFAHSNLINGCSFTHSCATSDGRQKGQLTSKAVQKTSARLLRWTTRNGAHNKLLSNAIHRPISLFQLSLVYQPAEE